jgi:MATE family multidrug resistance protein
VTAEAVVALTFGLLFLRKRNRREMATWQSRRFDRALMRRLMRFGLPMGFGWTVEMVAWTMFVFLVGRIGKVELAATNIAWRINGIAFFPIIGLAQAVGILVGNAQGAKRPDLLSRHTYKGLIMSQMWMVAAVALFLLAPRFLYGLFHNPATMDETEFELISQVGTVLLRFVALYSLLDAFNIVFITALQSAGDTRFTLAEASVAHLLFLGALLWVDHLNVGLNAEWGLATGFVMVQGLVWLVRFRMGRWRSIEVVE